MGHGSLAWQAGGVLELRCVSSFSVDVMSVWLWFWCGYFIMNGPFIWWVFCIPPPIRMLLLCLLFSTRLCVLSRQCQRFSSQATCFLHEQGDGFQRGQVFAKGEQSKCVFIQYNCAQLLDMTPARLIPDLVSHLRSLQIGVDLPRKRSWRGGRRKQKQSKQGSHLPPSSLSLTERLISEDQDLVGLIFLSGLPAMSTILQPFISPVWISATWFPSPHKTVMNPLISLRVV